MLVQIPLHVNEVDACILIIADPCSVIDTAFVWCVCSLELMSPQLVLHRPAVRSAQDAQEIDHVLLHL